MEPQDIERIVKLVSYSAFLIGYLSFKTVGQFMLRKDPDNLLLPLYFMKQVKPFWQGVYFAIAALSCTILIFTVYVSFAIMIATAISIYGGGIIARLTGKNVWLADKPPKPGETK